MGDSDLSEVIYSGRKATRGGSERRRINILDAALRVAVREGVRAVRHRAVASEANVPLSATTYYFKDIMDLLVDAFTLFYERAVAITKRDLVECVGETLKESTSDWKTNLADGLARYLLLRVHERKDDLIAEQALFAEAFHYDRLKDLALKYEEAFKAKFVQLVIGLPVKDVEGLAWSVYALQRQLSYEALLQAEPVSLEWLAKHLRPAFFALSERS